MLKLLPVLLLAITFSSTASNFTGKVATLKATEYRVGERIDDIHFDDLLGNPGKLSDYSDKKVLVIAMHKHNCPISKKYSPTLVRLMKDYANKDVAFLLVNTSTQATLEELKQAVTHYGFEVPYIPDFESLLAKALYAQSTTEVFVLDKTRTLRFRGPIDDQHGLGFSLPQPNRHHLKEAIDTLLADKEIEEKAFNAPGCLLALKSEPEPLSSVTFHNRISRLLQMNCQECHREGGVAPFPLVTYKDAIDHKGMIQWMVNQNFMPPWFASKTVGDWKNDRSLSARDKRALLHWLKSGTPEGDPKEAPIPRKWYEGWNIGKPDLILQVPKPYKIPAEGVMPYQYTWVQHNLKEDRWVKGIELRPTNAEVVHHIIVLVREKKAQASGEPLVITGFFAVYVPGETYAIYPEGLARKIPKDSELLFQIHYTPNGTATEDQPKIGLVFHEGQPKHTIDATSCYNMDFVIPPHHPNFEVKADITFEKRTRLYSFLPHMHLRGKAFRIDLEYPDGKKETVLDVPRYDFNWQLHYELRKPIDVPAGTKMLCTAVYDNSANNPFNPNPEQEVKYGEQTYEEMMFGFFESHSLE